MEGFKLLIAERAGQALDTPGMHEFWENIDHEGFDQHLTQVVDQVVMEVVSELTGLKAKTYMAAAMEGFSVAEHDYYVQSVNDEESQRLAERAASGLWEVINEHAAPNTDGQEVQR